MICEECKNTIYDQRGAATYGHKFDCSQAALEDQARKHHPLCTSLLGQGYICTCGKEICGAIIHVGWDGPLTCANPKPCKLHDYELCGNEECDGEGIEKIAGTEFHKHLKKSNLMCAHTDGSTPHPITEPCETRKSAPVSDCCGARFFLDRDYDEADETWPTCVKCGRHCTPTTIPPLSKPSEPTNRWEVIPQSITYQLPAEEIQNARAEGAKVERARIRAIVESLKLRPDNSHIGEELRSKYNQALKAVIHALDRLT